MDPPNLDQPCEDEDKYIKLAPEDDFPDNPYRAIQIWRSFWRAIFVFIISFLAFIFFSDSPLQVYLPTFFEVNIEIDLAEIDLDEISDLEDQINIQKPDSPPLVSLLPEDLDMETYLNQISHLTIQLDRKVIQASSIKEQIFPMLVSEEIRNVDSLPRASVDLICVFDFSQDKVNQKKQTQHVRSLFKEFLPLMTDQDRLSVVFIDNIYGKILSFLPFTNMTRENREKIISDIGENILKGEAPVIKDRTVNILGQRNGINQATGVIIISGISLEFEGDLFKDRLGLQNVKTALTLHPNHPSELDFFTQSLADLRNLVVETHFVIKPEQSQLIKGVQIINEYQEWIHISCGGPMRWSPRVDGSYQDVSNWLPLGMKEFVFDLKIPKITEPLSLSPMEVKIASCQLIFHLSNGSQVVRNVDLMVKVVGEGEGFVHEEGSTEVMRNLYSKWGDRLLSKAPYFDAAGPKEMLKRFQESLEKSAVKDDKQLRKRVKDTEATIAEIETLVFDESSL